MEKNKFIQAIVNGTSIDGVHFDEDIEILNSKSSRTSAKLYNSSFKKFVFPPVHYNDYTISQCVIETLVLKNVSIKSLRILDCRIKRLKIEKGFNGTILEIQETNDLEIIDIQGAAITNININNSNLKNFKIEGTANDHITVSNNKPENQIHHVSLKGKIPNFTISDVTINIVECNSLSGSIKITSCDTSNLIISKDAVINSLEISECKLGTIAAEGIVNNLSLLGGSFESIKLNKPFGNINTYMGRESKEDCKIICLDLCGVGGCLQLNSVELERLLLNDFVSSKQSHLRFVTITKSLQLENSSFENVKFHNVNLNTTSIRFINSSLMGSELTNLLWPDRYKLYEYHKELKGTNFKRKLDVLAPLKESYRQLKVLSLTQHNKIDAISFQKHELKIYWEIVNMKTFRSIRLPGFGNWLILFTNWLFSDFGQSIRRPIVWLLIFHSLFIYRILVSFDLGIIPQIDPALWDADAIRTGWGLYLNLLSPLHSSEINNRFINESRSIFGASDFFMRLSSGYFIYYFIRATRKYNTSI